MVSRKALQDYINILNRKLNELDLTDTQADWLKKRLQKIEENMSKVNLENLSNTILFAFEGHPFERKERRQVKKAIDSILY